MKIKIPTMKVRIVEYFVGRFVLWYLYRTKMGGDLLCNVLQESGKRWHEQLERKVKRDFKDHETRVLTRYLKLVADYLHKHGTDDELIRDAFQHANRKVGFHLSPHKNHRIAEWSGIDKKRSDVSSGRKIEPL